MQSNSKKSSEKILKWIFITAIIGLILIIVY